MSCYDKCLYDDDYDCPYSEMFEDDPNMTCEDCEVLFDCDRFS